MKKQKVAVVGGWVSLPVGGLEGPRLLESFSILCSPLPHQV